MITTSLTAGAGRASAPFRLPRRYLCAQWPETTDFQEPEHPEVSAALAERVRDVLGGRHLTPYIAQLERHFWLCAFFHGADRSHRASTYEADHPSAIHYIPRNAVLFVLDGTYGQIYLSAPEATPIHELLAALNGTLFPGRRYADRFLLKHFDLAPLRYLTPSDRHPSDGLAPWAHLQLKGLTEREGGENGQRCKRLWPRDGFEPLDCGCEVWPAHVDSAIMGIKVGRALGPTWPSSSRARRGCKPPLSRPLGTHWQTALPAARAWG